MKKKQKRLYRVRWEESHDCLIKAENEEKAIERVMAGEGYSDEVGELSASPVAFEIKE